MSCCDCLESVFIGDWSYSNKHILFVFSWTGGYKYLTLKKFKDSLMDDLLQEYDCDKLNKASEESKGQKIEHLVSYVENDQNCQGIIQTKMEVGIWFWVSNLGLSPKYD